MWRKERGVWSEILKISPISPILKILILTMARNRPPRPLDARAFRARMGLFAKCGFPLSRE